MLRRSNRVKSRKRVSSTSAGVTVQSKRPRRQTTSQVVASPPVLAPTAALPTEDSANVSTATRIPDDLVERITSLVTQNVTRELGAVLNAPLHSQPPTATPPTHSFQGDLIEVPATQSSAAPVSGEFADRLPGNG